VRTTDANHEKVVQGILTKLKENGDLYKGSYEGWYCVIDENFLTDAQLIEGNCPQCGREVEKIKEDNASSYEFLFGESENIIVAYTCFGLIPATAASYDLYWIAVDNKFRRHGYGKEIMIKTEDAIRSLGGKNIYAETSSRDLYRPTHIFYENRGYLREAFLKDVYAQGDSKIVYSKSLK
jgi:GNAT superfamily N-acetyltransferase